MITNVQEQGTPEFYKRFEKIPVNIFSDASDASRLVAKEIALIIREKQAQGEPCVLGLPAGSTPIEVYNELVRLHREEGLSFQNVITFNTDEFYPIHPNALQSHYRYMHEYLFDLVDIKPENIHLLEGSLPKDQIPEFCRKYEEAISSYGGVDFGLLGVDGAGQIGANEPGSSINSTTRLISLDYSTRVGSASEFYGESNVPFYSLTVGIGTIMKARRLVLMAWGESKAKIIRKLVEDNATEMVPASCLQKHPNADIVVDDAASAELTRIKTPWLIVDCEWDDKLIRRGVFWLCNKLNKPILKLTDRDYNDNGMNDLITEKGPASAINIKVFNDLQHTITGWPGGKPNADDSTRPERAKPFPKRVVVFSPHPDDDVISMGGTLARLSQHGHEVHVVYQVSGNIAVFDDDALRFLDFVRGYSRIYNTIIEKSDEIYQQAKKAMDEKKPGEIDPYEIQQVKGAVRRGEALAACRFINIPEERTHFLDMPFYETGAVKKKPIGTEDVKIIKDLLQKIEPHQIYAAGDLSDPHGTHRVCFQAIIAALKELKDESWIKDCRVWMYRGAWQEWDVADAEMAVPLSPEEAMIKRAAIFKHQSQKDRPLFPGTDPREFWQRAEDRNKATAAMYDKLGMAEYQAMELFVQYKF
ncbi:MAG: glucosamine-6-phosphate deaminase [Prevotellaceae bacterium]|jgi:glucosamine-6-phosphate deaminase|nr:glucosamine-6-phosphate deaminase [Prevotellaceae bacterium]